MVSNINHEVMRLLWQSQLWKLTSPWLTQQQTYGQRFVSTKTSNPLRILFCGSDNFSIGSLQALNAERLKDSGSIESIDVVCRPGKRVGRNLKIVREGEMRRIRIICQTTKRTQVPISSVAQALSLPLHQIDTFTGWNVRPTKIVEV